MSSARACLLVLVLVCLSAMVAAAPSSRLLTNRPRGPSSLLPNVGSASPNTPGVTLQLFMDPQCAMNISTADTLNSPINSGCQSASGISYNLICTSSGAATTFEYSVYATAGCQGAAMTSIKSAGNGRCLPTSIISNGQPAPIPLYATVTCNTAVDTTTGAVDNAAPSSEADVPVPSSKADVPVTQTRFNPLSMAHPRTALSFAGKILAKAHALAKDANMQ
jgi:hypothetical protein